MWDDGTRYDIPHRSYQGVSFPGPGHFYPSPLTPSKTFGHLLSSHDNFSPPKVEFIVKDGLEIKYFFYVKCFSRCFWNGWTVLSYAKFERERELFV